MSVGEPLLLGGYLCGGSDGTDYLDSAWGLEQPCAGSAVVSFNDPSHKTLEVSEHSSGFYYVSYRTCEYSDYNNSDEQSLTFDSYRIPEDDLELGQSRLLEVDNRVVLPAKTHLRIIITPVDVPHSWAIPSLGVKCDVVPGRLNQISILEKRPRSNKL
ncbi:cytochrome c oxidase subunit 2-like [Benincasa hispida]|uniref:cytochrome c oxidase subunit 2-like n=1 Tax=Benincasa hispida TaxID=102211 RepID=UPI00190218BA|nr:cytochrome c oxidase subunit 2-like [Benincasa hispida]